MKGRRFEKKIAHIVETKLYIGDLNSTGSHRLDDNGSPIWEESQGLSHLSITPFSPQCKPHSLPLSASLLLLPSKVCALYPPLFPSICTYLSDARSSLKCYNLSICLSCYRVCLVRLQGLIGIQRKWWVSGVWVLGLLKSPPPMATLGGRL